MVTGAIGIMLGILAILSPCVSGDHADWGWWVLLGVVAILAGLLIIWIESKESPRNRLTR